MSNMSKLNRDSQALFLRCDIFSTTSAIVEVINILYSPCMLNKGNIYVDITLY